MPDYPLSPVPGSFPCNLPWHCFAYTLSSAPPPLMFLLISYLTTNIHQQDNLRHLQGTLMKSNSQSYMLSRLPPCLLLCVLMAACISGCGGKPQTKAQSPAPQANAYLALGDSFTYGESVEYEDCWTVLLAQALRKNNIDIGEPIFCARTGWTTDDLQKALDKAHYTGPFRLVTLQIGVMDSSRSPRRRTHRLAPTSRPVAAPATAS